MPFLGKYNTLTVTGTTAIRIPIIKRAVVDFALSADWTPAAGDVKIAIDGAAAANVTNLPTAVAMGNTAYWEFILTAAELSCKSCVVTIADSATKAIEDQAFVVETFGHASAMYQADLSAANLPANVVQILATTLTETSGGYLAAAFKKWFDIAAPVATVATVNQTADNNTKLADIQTRIPAALTANGNMKSSVLEFITTTITEGAAGRIAAAWQGFWNVTTPVATAQGVNQTGDSFARIGATGSGLTSLASASALATAQADLTTLTGRLTSARAGYLDNLNVGGAVASNADILALNQSASRRIILTTAGQYERPESGSTVYTIEARTYDGDGAAVNADSNPTLTVTGQTTGSLAANVGVISNPATGVYRWTYTQGSAATLEPIRVDVSAVISGSTFTLSAYTQSVDFVAATWSTTDAANLTAIFNKLPSRTYLAGSTAGTGAAVPADIGLSTANLDTQLDALPTNAELATALAASDDATLAAIAAEAVKTTAIQSSVTAVATDVTTLLGRITANVYTMFTNLIAMITGTGGSAKWTATALSLAPTGGGGSGLTGPFTRLITVTDSATDDPIENAKVRIYRTGETETQQTDELGEVEFTTEAATWSYAVTATGYAGASGTIVITDDGETVIELTAIVVTPGDADATTGWLITRDANGDPLASVVVSFKHARVPIDDTGSVFPATVREFTSDVNGLVECPVIRGGKYNIWCGNQAESEILAVVIPLAAGDTYELPSLISAP